MFLGGFGVKEWGFGWFFYYFLLFTLGRVIRYNMLFRVRFLVLEIEFWIGRVLNLFIMRLLCFFIL